MILLMLKQRGWNLDTTDAFTAVEDKIPDIRDIVNIKTDYDEIVL